MASSGRPRGGGPFLGAGQPATYVVMTRAESATHVDQLKSRLASPVPDLYSGLLMPSRERQWDNKRAKVQLQVAA